MLRPGEFGDLQEVAGSWGVPPATAAWAIVSTFLSDCRDKHPTLPVGMAATLALVAKLGLEGGAPSAEGPVADEAS